MKILHTSDWHLGHTLYGYDRMEEQKSMLDQMVAIVREHQPDVFLLCGDVYDTGQPSNAVQTMLSNAMMDIHEACPTMTIVMTAGNHDSGSKHEIFRIPWERLNVYAIGQLYRENLENHIVKVLGKDNVQLGWVVAVPYANERNIPEGFFHQLLDYVTDRNDKNLPVVMCAHTTVQGCEFAGHDHASEKTVGGIDSIAVERMGNGYDYLALGHIHKGQFIHTGNHNVRYSGTPIAVSFDENYPHSVTLVEIATHGQLPLEKGQVKELEIENLHPLVTLPKEGFTSWEDALALLKDYPADIPAYIRLNVEVDDYLPANAKETAIALTKEKKCTLCHINAKRKSEGTSEERSMTVQEFKAEDPIEIARLYAKEENVNFDEEMEAMFKEVVHLVAEDERK